MLNRCSLEKDGSETRAHGADQQARSQAKVGEHLASSAFVILVRVRDLLERNKSRCDAIDRSWKRPLRVGVNHEQTGQVALLMAR